MVEAPTRLRCYNESMRRLVLSGGGAHARTRPVRSGIAEIIPRELLSNYRRIRRRLKFNVFGGARMILNATDELYKTWKA